ncbi:MAG: SUMF1/EgtB/PvdO family nonheme iron enzyme [Planctomycetota bacterium]
MFSGSVRADAFGTGGSQFTIDFVSISGDTNPVSGIPAGSGFTFVGVDNDYRMGTLEITNDQWDRFKTELGVPVTGDPSDAYDQDPGWTGTNRPTNGLSWLEAAQFVNWLNTSAGHQAAYKFTGTQGTSDYTLSIWSTEEADNGTNLYRHKDSFYYLPTEGEWVKAAYWNGTELQTWATTDDSQPVVGVDSNYGQSYPFDAGPWDVGTGNAELNGTFDMMGNVWEWMESPSSEDFGTDSPRSMRGGTYADAAYRLASSARFANYPAYEEYHFGFRVASEVPEPTTLSLLLLGGVAVLSTKRR